MLPPPLAEGSEAAKNRKNNKWLQFDTQELKFIMHLTKKRKRNLRLVRKHSNNHRVKIGNDWWYSFAKWLLSDRNARLLVLHQRMCLKLLKRLRKERETQGLSFVKHHLNRGNTQLAGVFTFEAGEDTT